VAEAERAGVDRIQVVVMTVNPGFGHQPFIYSTLPKIRRVGQVIEQLKPECELEVDGGIDEATAPLTVAAERTCSSPDRSIFGADIGVRAAMRRLRNAIHYGEHQA
jgi:ribulose-phosphate 3-epimerase